MNDKNSGKAILKNIMDEFLNEEIHYGALEKLCYEFRTYLLDITGLDLNDLEDRKDLEFENGIALCTTFAALCTHDILRTRQFVRGIYKAILDRKQEKSDPIHVFYAGTGPFATLILPILTRFSSDEIQLTLMDVNRKTLKYLDKTLKHLSIENYVHKIVCADATCYEIANPNEVDILVSETMQQGLVKEQQVPIMINLVSQLPEKTIVIPNSIDLELALKNSSIEPILNNKPEEIYHRLTSLWKFNPEFMRMNHDGEKSFPLCKDEDFKKEVVHHDELVVMTSIHVYKDEWIYPGQSGLTIGKTLFKLDQQKNKRSISLNYEIKAQPNFSYQLN